MCCKFCGSKKVSVIRSIKSIYIDESYDLHECDQCKNRFFSLDQYTQVTLKDLYDRQALETSNLYQLKWKKDKYWSNEVKTIKRLHAGTIENILDIGCRTGDFLMHWDDDIHRCGIETAEYSANIGVQRGLTIKKDFIENVKFEHKFDVVTCYAVIEHLDNPIQFLNNLEKLINKGGILVIMIPGYQCIKERCITKFGQQWHMYSPPEHLNFFTEDFLVNYMKMKKLQLMNRKYTTGGLFNPFQKMSLLHSLWGRLVWSFIDSNSWINKYQIFDHMYLYFQKNNDD